jgi:hypothetical protein
MISCIMPDTQEPPTNPQQRLRRTARMRDAELQTLRTYLVDGLSPSQICKMMKISSTTYYRYYDLLYKQEKKHIDDDSFAQKSAAIEMSVLKDRLTSIVLLMRNIMVDEDETSHAKMDAAKIYGEVSMAIGKLALQGTTVLRSLSPEARGLATNPEALANWKQSAEAPALEEPKPLEVIDAKTGIRQEIDGRKRLQEVIESRRKTNPEQPLESALSSEEEEDEFEEQQDDDDDEPSEDYDPISGKGL